MNNITIAGALGKDAEIRYLNDGKPVTSFSVADSQYGDKGPIWWKCTIFGDRGPKLEKYLKKGQAVTVSGSITESEYVNKDGVKTKSFDIRVADVALQGGRRDDDEPSHKYRDPEPAPRYPQTAPKPISDASRSRYPAERQAPQREQFDDGSDVPF